MKIEVERLNDAFHLRATNETGNSVETDASPNIGGSQLGMRPMEMLLSSMACCSSIDVIHILRKQRQPLEGLEIEVSGDRAEDYPKPWRAMHIHYILYGSGLDPRKVERAIELSVEKYCGAHATVAGVAKMSHDYEIRAATPAPVEA